MQPFLCTKCFLDTVNDIFNVCFGDLDAVEVQKLTSVFTQLRAGVGLKLQYDGRGGRVYLQLDSRWRGQTLGLCGTFNGNLRDDFLWENPAYVWLAVEMCDFAWSPLRCRSPAGMIEGTPQLHANAWKISSACIAPVNQPVMDPCELNQNNGKSHFFFLIFIVRNCCHFTICGIWIFRYFPEFS